MLEHKIRKYKHLQTCYSWQDEPESTTLSNVPDFALYEEYVKGLGLGEDQVAAACSKWNRTVWFARRHGAAVSTVPSGCSGQVQFQFEGSRLIAIIDLEELQLLSEHIKEHSMQYVYSVFLGQG